MEFFVANRLIKSIKLSYRTLKYVDIVRKCLVCDFGDNGDELNDPALHCRLFSTKMLYMNWRG
jgi:hypothetical protein